MLLQAPPPWRGMGWGEGEAAACDNGGAGSGGPWVCNGGPGLCDGGPGPALRVCADEPGLLLQAPPPWRGRGWGEGEAAACDNGGTGSGGPWVCNGGPGLCDGGPGPALRVCAAGLEMLLQAPPPWRGRGWGEGEAAVCDNGAAGNGGPGLCDGGPGPALRESRISGRESRCSNIDSHSLTSTSTGSAFTPCRRASCTICAGE